MIKFASRRNIHLIQNPDKEEKSSHGLRCAYSVCLFFQIAALEEFVTPINNDDNWPSNKHVDVNNLEGLEEKMGPNSFKQYVHFIQNPCLEIQGKKIKNVAKPETKSIDRDNQKYESPINRWVGKSIDLISDEEFEQILTKAMMADPKYVSAKNLQDLLFEDKDGWQLVGMLNPKNQI